MKKVKLLFSKLKKIFINQKAKVPKEKNIYEKQLTSQPYIVNIENTTDKPINDVVLFFGNNQNENKFTKDGKYVESGLVISSGIPDVTYKQIVNNFVDNHFSVSLTYIQSITSNQVLEKLTFKYQDANGNFFGKVIVPTIDPYQQQTNIVAVKSNYYLDGNSSIILHKIYPKTTLKIYIYPEVKMYNSKINDGKYYTNEDISIKLQAILQINDK
jgi:hypothetical protein